MKQTKLFETGKQKQQLSLLPALLTLVMLVSVGSAWGQSPWTKNAAGDYDFQIAGAKVTKIEVWGAGGSGVWSGSGGRGGGGGGYACLDGLTSSQIAIGSLLKVHVGAGNSNEQPGEDSWVKYGRGILNASGGGSGAGSGEHSPGGSGSTSYILDGSTYNSSTSVGNCSFISYTGGQGGTNAEYSVWNMAGGGGGCAGANGNGIPGGDAVAKFGSHSNGGGGGANGDGIGGAGGAGKNGTDNGESGKNYGGGGGGCKDGQTPGKGGTGYVRITYTIVKVTVSFNTQGGSGSPGTLSNVVHGTTLGSYSSSGWIPTKTGHSFLGWNSQPDGSGAFYGPNSTSNFESDVTLHAIWIKNIDLQDLVLCRNEQRQLTDVPCTYTNYSWTPATAFSNNSCSPVIDASKLNLGANTISLNAIYEKVYNGGFEDGTHGFYSTHAYETTPCENCMVPERRYAIVTCWRDGRNEEGEAWPGPETFRAYTGTKYMMVNGGWMTDEAFWEQTLRVKQNKTYTFSFYLGAMGTGNPASITVYINGSPINASTPFTYTQANTWQLCSVTWNSGSNTMATIQLKNSQTEYAGNDFGIDDISFTCGESDIQTTSSATVYVLPEVSSPTSLTATKDALCLGESVTFTANGGTGDNESIIWSETGCPQVAYFNDFHEFDFSTHNCSNTRVNSAGNLEIKSTNNDPMIDMYGVCNANPSNFKYFKIRYRITSGTGGAVEVFFASSSHNYAEGGYSASTSLNSDGNWHIATINASSNSHWTGIGNITGWRFDFCNQNNVTMEIDYIALTNSSVTGSSYKLTTPAAGSHTVYADLLAGCKTGSCIQKTVTVYNPSVTLANMSAITACAGGTINLAAVTSGTPVGNVTYSWTGPNGYTATGQNPTISNATTAMAGQYTVVATATQNGCTATDTKTVTVTVNAPSVTLADMSAITVCAGGNINLAASTSGTPVGNVTYSWTGPNGYTATGQNPSRSNATTAMAGQYTVVATATVGSCTVTDTKTVTVTVSAPSVTLADMSAITVCAGDNINLAASTSGTPVGDVTYSWTGPNDYTATGQSQTRSDATTAMAGTYTVVATATLNGCTATDTKTVNVTVNDPRTGTSVITGTTPICKGNSSTLSVSTTGSNGDIIYTWNNGLGEGSSKEVTPSSTTTYTVRVKATVGTCYVTVTESYVVEVNELPTLSVTPVDVLCNGDPTGKLSVTVGGTTPDYKIYLGGIDGTLKTTLTADGSYDITGLGTGTYTVAVKDGNGCQTTVTNNTIGQPEPLTIAQVDTTTNAKCKDDHDGWFKFTVSGGTPNYTVSVKKGSSTDVPATQISNSGNTYTVSGLDAGTYTVTVTDAHGCIATGTTSYTVGEPAAALTVNVSSTPEGCDPHDNGTATAAPSGGNGGYTFVWSMKSATDDTWTVLTTQTGAEATGLQGQREGYSGVYKVVVTDKKGCTAEGSATVQLNNPLAMTNITGPTICTGNEFVITPANVTNGVIPDGTTYSWPAPENVPDCVTGSGLNAMV
ncbi:MAG: InlB B-repeat-containing protein, partial [Bacteroidales bacterium]|nr:InlB B-repeat-containing protein [Bacteroidales bacterium]